MIIDIESFSGLYSAGCGFYLGLEYGFSEEMLHFWDENYISDAKLHYTLQGRVIRSSNSYTLLGELHFCGKFILFCQNCHKKSDT